MTLGRHGEQGVATDSRVGWNRVAERLLPAFAAHEIHRRNESASHARGRDVRCDVELGCFRLDAPQRFLEGVGGVACGGPIPLGLLGTKRAAKRRDRTAQIRLGCEVGRELAQDCLWALVPRKQLDAIAELLEPLLSRDRRSLVVRNEDDRVVAADDDEVGRR